ncbi:TetR family transcriptional regulator [Tamaricihabitans halophyticus]|uniref:TetR family transcriptional regulator n=1 Tax=Tamaricihabitans halophyticus TaxID=1262583 RepID=A0A4R2R3N4_9PSEU|nr:TetR/AcrR family transcriptional regulator [Tamaricihabitans halophyticus]TCP56329.1 TetR family transcriptional regulator [Tamaricihabitans halophyticus]
MTGTNPPTTRRYRGRTAEDRRAQRRERLLAAGLELFGTKGYTATSIEKLCSTAGVSTRNFYEEFTSREALLIALHDRTVTEGMRRILDRLAGLDEAPLAERVEVIAGDYVSATASDARLAKVTYVELTGVSPEVERHRLVWRQRWVEFIVGEANRAVRRGEIPERDYTLSAVALIGALNELVYQHSLADSTIELTAVIGEIRRLTMALTVT